MNLSTIKAIGNAWKPGDSVSIQMEVRNAELMAEAEANHKAVYGQANGINELITNTLVKDAQSVASFYLAACPEDGEAWAAFNFMKHMEHKYKHEFAKFRNQAR